MTIQYSVEVSYKLDNELKISQLDMLTRYMQIVEENQEIVDKDTILNNIGLKYNTDMNSHDFDVQMSNPFIPGTVLLRNTNFYLNNTNVVNFLNDIPNTYHIQFINKKFGNNHYRIYDIKNKTINKKLSDLDNEIIQIVKNR
jgi:hypothetical protein